MPRPINEEDRKDLKRRLLDGVRRVVNGDPGRTLGGQPVSAFLAGPAPGDPLGDFQHRSGRAVCDRWARGDRASILPGRDVYYRQLCEPYLGANMPGDAATEPPFEGGQCPVRHSLSVVWSSKTGTSCTTNQGGTFNFTCSGGSANNIVFGPISGYISQPISGSSNVQLRLSCRDANGQPVTRQFATNVCPGTESVSIQNVVRCDGLSTSCGNVPDEFDAGNPNASPDPNPGPVGSPTGYPFPDVDVTVNPDGTIGVDFGDGQPTETIDPGAEDPGASGPAPGEIGEAAPPEDTGNDGEASDCAPENKVIGALKLDLVTTPSTAKIYAPGVFRGACYVYMGTTEGLDHDPAGAMLVSGQVVFPEKDNLTCWKVVANAGYDIRVTPYYIEA